MRKTCETCAWWTELGKHQGLCRRFPPLGDVYTRTASTDWCGEHAPKEACDE